MQNLKLEYDGVFGTISREELKIELNKNSEILDRILGVEEQYKNDLGWFNTDTWGNDFAINELQQKALELRKKADVFIIIGVGGSNQASRAVIKAMDHNNKDIEILYAGNNLSTIYLEKLVQSLEGKSVYINIIAKNFQTIEPGISFRILRQYLESRYKKDAKGRIIVTGTRGSKLWQLAKEKNYTFLEFPEDMGGRYSVISPVGLFPMAVAGIDIKELVQGASDMEEFLKNTKGKENPAFVYASIRNMLLNKGYNIEILSSFEPDLDYFGKWWKQIFAESEGKEGKGIFPVTCSFSEDLHSIGQYIQEGQRMLMETFLKVEKINYNLSIMPEENCEDYFSYLDHKSLWEINDAAYQATLKAHISGGVPCMVIKIPEITPYYFGQMFYFFQFACYISSKILGVNPFDQPGVEAYKNNMFEILEKNN